MISKKPDFLLKKEEIERKLQSLGSLKHTQMPASGWIKSIRGYLGLTTKQLADRMGIAQPNVMAIEDRELRKAITLETLEKAALAMDCKLIYAIVPNDTLQIVNKPPIQVAQNKPTNDSDDWLSQLQKNLRNPS